MTLHIGVLTVKGKEYHPTKRLAEAAAVRNAEVVPIHPYGVQPGYTQGRPFLLGNPEASRVQAVLPRQCSNPSAVARERGSIACRQRRRYPLTSRCN